MGTPCSASSPRRDGALTLDDSDDAVNYGGGGRDRTTCAAARGGVLPVRREDVPGDGPVAAILRYPIRATICSRRPRASERRRICTRGGGSRSWWPWRPVR